MGIVLGIDVGGSTTKIVGLHETEGRSTCLREHRELSAYVVGMLQVRAADQVTSMYGALGNFLSKHNLKPSDVSKIYLTGVGASFIDEQVHGIETHKVNEFTSIGRGALSLTELDEALILSMGTGTALVKAKRDLENTVCSPDSLQSNIIVYHLGGSGVGGGTIMGLASQMLGKSDVDAILALAENGDLGNIDLFVSDILKSKVSSLPFDLTAANFGKMKSTASNSDIALGIINMVFETAGMMAVFALRNEAIKDVIVTGSLAVFPQAETIFAKFNRITGYNFIIPESAVFATALGAAL